MGQDPLAQLRDIHLPDAISWWPPAPGWWLVGAIFVALLVYGLWRWLNEHRNNTYRRQAISELEQAWKQYRSNHDGQAYVKLCNIVLRRAALHRDSVNRRAIAPLAGREWFDYLDSCCKQAVFAGNISADLYEAQYRPHNADQAQHDLRDFHKASLKWLKSHP